MAEIHESEAQHVLILGGIGASKSFGNSHELWPHLSIGPIKLGETYTPRLYWLVGPEYEDCRAEFTYLYNLADATGILGKYAFPEEGKCYFETTTGARVETRSGDNPGKCMAGRGPAGIIWCEMGRITKKLFERGLSRLARSEDGMEGWSIGGGVIEDSLPWFLEMFETGQDQPNEYDLDSFNIPSWDNEFTFPLGRNDPKILRLERVLSVHDFKERIEGLPAPTADTVFPEFDRSIHVKKIPFIEFINPKRRGGRKRRKQVWLAIDPGYDPGYYAVLAIQQKGPYIFVIDEVYFQHKLVTDIIRMCKKRKWWKNVVGGIIDPFGGTQHQAMPSHREEWKTHGGVQIYAGARVGILTGIKRYRHFLSRGPDGRKKAYVFFDRKCRGTIREHRRYRRQSSKEGRALRVVPIDADNHGIKALTYFIASTRRPNGLAKKRTRRVKMGRGGRRAA